MSALSIFERYLFVLISMLLVLPSCDKNSDNDRNNKETDLYFKGRLINKSGNPVYDMTVVCRDEFWDEQRTIDSLSKDGSYLVYYYTFSDPHTYHLHNAYIKAYNTEFFGDTLIDKSLFRTDTLTLDIIVKPVGNIVLAFHDLTNIQRVILSTIDVARLGGMSRNSSLTEFIPTSTDTIIFIPAYPDRINNFQCWFNTTAVGKAVLDSSFRIESGDSIHFEIYQ